jgi:hypothetical protein
MDEDAAFVGWVERQRNPSKGLMKHPLMGFADAQPILQCHMFNKLSINKVAIRILIGYISPGKNALVAGQKKD